MRERPLVGVALLLVALFCFALLDATSKHLSQTYSVPLLVWARYTLHCLIMVLTLAPSLRMKLIATQRPLAQVFRGSLLVAVTGLAMAAFRITPLAEATALLFVAPLFVVALAGPLLGEKAGGRRWLAVLAGFGGTLLIARPGGAVSATGIALTLTAAVCYSLYQIMTRRLSATESTVTMLFYTALMGSLLMTLGLPWFWGGPQPTPLDALMIASLGVYGGVGHFLLIRAFRHAPASMLSPFQYIQLVWAALLGWGIYGQLPDGLSILGMAVVVASGILVALTERRRHVAPEQSR